MNDMQAVREAAERLKRMDAGAGIQNVYGQFSPNVDDMAAIWNGDRIRTSEAFIDLTDPTLLTVEKLVEAGFKPCRIDGHFSRGRLEAARIGKGFDFWVGDTPLQLPPRTVGHLRQLLLRMEKQ